VDVLEHQHQRAACRSEVLDQAPEAPRDLAIAALTALLVVGRTDDHAQALGNVGVGRQGVESGVGFFGTEIRIDPAQRADHLRRGPVGDALAVRQAAAAHDRPAFTRQAIGGLTNQAALAHAGHAQDGEEHGLLLVACAARCIHEHCQLLVAAGQRGLQTGDAARAADVCRHGRHSPTPQR